MLTTLELCAGYNGLGLAVEAALGATTIGFCENDPAPARILAHHYPHVPNYGDITAIDWAAIPSPDIISGGTPCQDLSHAGQRAGMTEGTRSNLWVQMREAIATHRPQWVVWENVRGAYSARADSNLEQCPRCMGNTRDAGQPALRALGRVLGDLADLGYDAQWRGLRAADVGACHPRYRVFLLAQNTSSGRRPETVEHHGRRPQAHHRAGLPHQPDSDPDGAGPQRTAAAAHPDDTTGQQRRLPAPRQTESGRARADTGGRGGTPPTDWGPYTQAIRRWEHVTGRPAPRPTEPTGRVRAERLSPRFTEWMMGLPDGWVTDPAIGLTRNQQLKVCGDGVVPLQAQAALTAMLHAHQT